MNGYKGVDVRWSSGSSAYTYKDWCVLRVNGRKVGSVEEVSDREWHHDRYYAKVRTHFEPGAASEDRYFRDLETAKSWVEHRALRKNKLWLAKRLVQLLSLSRDPDLLVLGSAKSVLRALLKEQEGKED